MKTFDLTQIIQENMPVYPGTPPPLLKAACSVEKAGYKETVITMYSHTGTHMDAPAHLLSGGRSLDRLPAERFWGSAAVIDCRMAPPGSQIGLDYLKGDLIRYEKADFLLLMTGWERYWGQEAYNQGFPVPGRELIEFMAESGKKGMGVDALSVDPVEAEILTNHRLLLGREMVIVENLRGLAQLDAEAGIHFFALPLNFINADGAPVRAIAITE